MTTQLFLDDFAVGQKYPSVSRTLDMSHYVLFSAITGDSHPIHYDAEYVRKRGLPGPVAHGLLLTAMTALGAAPVSHQLEESMMAMLGTTVRFRRIATTGDTVRTEFTVAAVEPKGTDRGILRLALALRNQRDEILVEGEHQIMLKRRTAA